jgi:hypothetical protein
MLTACGEYQFRSRQSVLIYQNYKWKCSQLHSKTTTNSVFNGFETQAAHASAKQVEYKAQKPDERVELAKMQAAARLHCRASFA